MGSAISKSTFEAEQVAITTKFEAAIKQNTGTGYNNARSEIESILNSTPYMELEVDEAEYPTGLEKIISIFPVVNSMVQHTVTLQILYSSGNPDSSVQYLVHMTLLPGINNEAIHLVPYKNSFSELKTPGELYDHTSLNVLSTVKRCPPKCKPRKHCRKKKYCGGCCVYHYESDESSCGDYY